MSWEGEGSTVSKEQAGDAPTLKVPLSQLPLLQSFPLVWLTVDRLFRKEHDLVIGQQLQEACFLTVAMDCSTKSRAREIKRATPNRVPLPQTLSTQKGFRGSHFRTSSGSLKTISHVLSFWIRCSLWLIGVEGPSVRTQPTAFIGTWFRRNG